jgi:hypothetical protein
MVPKARPINPPRIPTRNETTVRRITCHRGITLEKSKIPPAVDYDALKVVEDGEFLYRPCQSVNLI